jgi:hypothetical protein
MVIVMDDGIGGVECRVWMEHGAGWNGVEECSGGVFLYSGENGGK